MTFKGILALTILVAVVATFVWERNAVAKLREQNKSLRSSKEEADRLDAENGELAKLHEDTTATGASAERSELLRLRNEARRLRSQKQEADRLRGENERLAANLNSGSTTPSKLSEMEGYVGKETWANVGLTTPESAAQSFFWAVSTGNLDQLVACFAPEAGEEISVMRRQIQQRPEEFRKSFFSESNPFRKVNGYRIAERTSLAEDRIRVGIQVAANGAVLPLTLRRVGNEWKIEDFD